LKTAAQLQQQRRAM